jgi:hypothetical protein
MIGRLLFIACAACLAAASPANAQNNSGRRDGCGGDACATGAPYDLGYHDGYEGNSYTSLSDLKLDPQYEAGFSEGEMDAMDEKGAMAAEKQVRSDRLDRQSGQKSIASRRVIEDERAQDRLGERSVDRQAQRGMDQQTNSTLDAFFSNQSDMAAMGQEDAITAQEQAGGWRQMDRRRQGSSDPNAGLLTTQGN